MNDGILLIDKPAGMTSFGVVARIRRVLSKQQDKRVKVGHTGTLDPFATGLMILVVGNECKNAGLYTKLDKVYEATIRLGQTSSTGDPEGTITNISNNQPSRQEIETVIGQFRGEISQRPPLFSAIKIDGIRAYTLARNGQEIELPERHVIIYELDVLHYEYPFLKIRAHVSSGTYIRSLAADIGHRLGTGAYCYELRRLQVGKRNIAQAKTLHEFGIND